MKGNDISVIPSLTIPFIQFNRSLSFYFVSMNGVKYTKMHKIILILFFQRSLLKLRKCF